MANPPKSKGTRFETKTKRRLEAAGFRVERREANARYDLDVREDPKVPYAPEPVKALVTEPDYGRTLVTITMEDFMGFLWSTGWGAHLECKKGNTYKAIHTLWNKEM